MHPYLERYFYVIQHNNYDKQEALAFLQMVRLKERKLGWAFKEKEKKVTYQCKQKVNGLLEMPAGINIKTGKIHYWFYDWKNSFVVIECLEKLLDEYPGKEVYAIMDNWSAHKSYDVKVWNTFHPRMHLVYLPSGASFMNMIERVFSRLDYDILQNSKFENVRGAMESIELYFNKEARFSMWGS